MTGDWFRPLYRAGLRLAPDGFRRRYGEEALDVALTRLRQAPRSRRPAVAARELTDLALTVLREWQDLGGSRRAESRAPFNGGMHASGRPSAIHTLVRYVADLRDDLRFACRGFIRAPGFALIGVLSMGLGIGLTTVVYHSKWQLISEPLPGVRAADQLIVAERPVSYVDIEQYRELSNLFAGVAALEIGVPFNLTISAEASAKPERIFGQLVSADYFTVLGVTAERGRVLSADIDKPGVASVVVSDRFWKTRLSESPDAVGLTLRLNGQPVTVVGVAPPRFGGALSIVPSDLFVPITAPMTVAPELRGDVLHDRTARQFLPLIRLVPGISIETAEAAATTAFRHVNQEHRTAAVTADRTEPVSFVPAGTAVPIPRNVKPAVLGFCATLMGLIMAIACLNLANMSLAQGIKRRAEWKVRLAIGASRARLVRMLVTEGLALSLLGGLAGFGLADALTALNAHLAPPSAVPSAPASAPDWSVAWFVFLVAVISGIAFSLVPALRVTKTSLTLRLRDGDTVHRPAWRRVGLRSVLMAVQLTGSLVLLLITGFLIFGLHGLEQFPDSSHPDSTYLLSLDPVRDGYTPGRAEAFFERLPDLLTSSGITGRVSLAAQAPFSVDDDEDAAIRITTENTPGRSAVQISAVEDRVGAGYFGILGEAMLAGREFVDADEWGVDDSPAITPTVLNTQAARDLFGSTTPIGARLRDDRKVYQVVGVVNEVRFGVGIEGAALYLPLSRINLARPPADGLTVLVRTSGGSDGLPAFRRAIGAFDPNLSLLQVRTLRAYLNARRASEQKALSTYGSMGLFGLVLAAIGLAGVTAYTAAQRRKEIGVRVALGAQRGQIIRLVLRESLVLVGVGTVFGLLGALGVATALSALTTVLADSVHKSMGDPRLLLGAPMLMAALTLLASYLPARGASRRDPLNALREG